MGVTFRVPGAVRPFWILLLLATCDKMTAPEADRTPPEIALRAPTPEAVIDGDSVVIEGTVRDDRKVTEVGYRVNAGDEAALPITPAAEVPIRLVLRGLPLGPNEVELLVSDEAEQVTMARVAFTLTDATPPVVTLTLPAAGVEAETDSVMVEGAAEDSRGVARVVFVVNDGSEQEARVDSGSVRTPFRFMARGLRVGVNTLEVRAYDASGNRGIATHTMTSRDVSPPELTVDRPADGETVESDTLVVEGVAADDRGVVRLAYQLDGEEVVQVAAGVSPRVSFRTVLRGLAPGAHRLVLTAADAAENATVVRRAVTVAEAGPGTLKPGDLQWREVVTGLEQPLHLAAPAGDSRLFIVEQPGRIRIVEDGKLRDTPFLDVSGKTLFEGDQGLLGLAFHPDYARNGYFYIDYIDLNGDTRVERYRVSPDRDRADPASMEPVLFIDQPSSLHKAGTMLFGPDGMLYISSGDGAGAADFYGNAQNPGTLLGAVLRIDVDAGQPYGIPADNPYVGVPGARGEVWAMGLRNPWRFSLDAEGTLYLGDVGEDSWEEIDVAPAPQRDLNFGWPVMEGSGCFRGQSCDQSAFLKPLVQYSHQEGCSVIGGMVYQGRRIAALRGRYVYSDFCSGFLRSFRYAGGLAEDALDLGTPVVGNATAIGADGSGELYLVTYTGSVFRLERRPTS